MSNEPKTQPSPNAKVWAGKRIANWIKRDLLSLKRHQEIVDCLNPLLNIIVRPGDAYRFLYSDANCVLTYPSSGSSSSSDSDSGSARMFKIDHVHDDYIVCRSWDGTTEGTTDVYVAKDSALRVSLTSETIFGEVHTYIYSNGPDTNNVYREDAVTGGSIDAQQLVVPGWYHGQVIWAVPVDYSGVNDPQQNDIKLLNIAPARMWSGGCG